MENEVMSAFIISSLCFRLPTNEFKIKPSIQLNIVTQENKENKYLIFSFHIPV